jgi:predicted acylesterase/phospholipase RssA
LADENDQAAPRFPASENDRVERELRALYKSEAITEVVCSAARGADLLALKVARDLGLHRRIVLPFGAEEFRKTSVGGPPDGLWDALFSTMIEEARRSGDLIELPGSVEDKDGAYLVATEAIFARARADCVGDPPIVVLVWEGAVRGSDDLTAVLGERARSEGVPVANIRSNPFAVLGPRAAAVLAAAELCARAERRKMLDPALADVSLAESDREHLAVARALATYKDPSLAPSRALEESRAALAPFVAYSTSPETLGVAGAIEKRRWEVDGRREHLERAAGFYEKGHACERVQGWEQGYPGVNAAYVLDVLVSLDRADPYDFAEAKERAARRARRAEEIRQELKAALAATAQADGAGYWSLVTMAEVHFGLGEYDEAAPYLARAAPLAKAKEGEGWKLETTARQLAAIARFHEGANEAASTRAWDALHALLGDKTEAVRGAFIGKVGLALSGGGFRASLFHIGVLARLAELDFLRHVEVLSCVSGGSIVGAHYYLELQHMLEGTPDGNIRAEHYVDLVRRVADRFLEGVPKNIRMRVLCDPCLNFEMLRGRRSRTERAGELYEQLLYHSVGHGKDPPRRGLEMRNLFIAPYGTEGFDPRNDNWGRANKVPRLVVNATTLNTGHAWQFTPTTMGEPPPRIGEDIDSNARLPSVTYADVGAHRTLSLGRAVAASACVPVLFDPVVVDGVHGDSRVLLVDGGVHDNQGVASLLEQSCTVLLVSDASGQMSEEKTPSSAAAAVGLRSDSIFQARIREAQYLDLSSRRRGGLLQGLMFLHLKEGIEPAGASAAEGNQATGYGVSFAVQERLAAIRTDLDAFSEVESKMLMASGYAMTKWRFAQDIKVPRPMTTREGTWDFAAANELLRARPDDGSATSQEVLRLLGVGERMAFKAWWLSPRLQRIAAASGACALALAASAALHFWDRPVASITVGRLVLGLALAALLAAWPGLKLAVALVQPRRALAKAGAGVLAAFAGAALSKIHIALFDRIYLEYGKLDRVRKLGEQRTEP